MGDPGAFLRSFVPAALSDVCGAAPDGLVAVGRHFKAAVLVADISGFTALAERFGAQGPAGAETLAGVINTYFGSQLTVLDAYGGAPTKFAGDSMIALWPAATAGELATATWRAAACGLALQRESATPGGTRHGLRLRAGVSAGRVWAARVGGVSGRWDHVLAGDPVIDASKAASSVAPGGVGLAGPAAMLLQPAAIGASGADGVVALTSIPAPPAVMPAARGHTIGADLLAAFVPRMVAERVAAGQLDWLAEFRRVTVLFLSVGHFDDGAADALERLRRAMTAVQREAYRFDGSLNQVLADDKGLSFVVGWNLPTMAHEDAAARAVRASVALLAALRGEGLAPALGLATGTAFCGLRGGDQCREYAMVGAVVNRAARIVQKSDGRVLCDEATARAAGDRVVFAPGAALTLKGIAAPVPTFEPTGEQALQPRVHARLVGRSSEFGIYQSRLDRLVATGDSAVVLIEGEPGIGKSRLMAACVELTASAGVRSLAGAADAVEIDAPYFVWRPVLRELLGVAVEDGDALRHALELRFAGHPDPLGWLPLLGPAFAVDLGETEVTRAMTPEARAERTRELLVVLLQDACRDCPLAVFLDDGHWFDSASWSLAAVAAQQVRRLLLVTGTRPLDQPVPPDAAMVRRLAGDAYLRLEPLSAECVLDIVRERLGVDELPAAVAPFIHRRAAGNPFFSEQLAFALRDRGHLRVEGRRCRLAPGVQDLGRLDDVPESLEGVITGRVDALDADSQLTLKVASVIGRAFRTETLMAVHPMGVSREELSGRLSELARRDLVVAESGGTDPEYLFKHVVLRDVVYALMTIEQRRGLHRAVARRLELQHGDDLTPVLGLLAHHWRQTGEAATAVGYLERAGEQAFNAAASEETIHLVTEAVALTREHGLPVAPAQRARWHWWRGFAHVRAGHFLAANTDLREGLSLLGQRTPSTKAAVAAGLIAGLLRQATRLVVGTRARRVNGQERDHARLAASLYHRYIEVQWNLQAPLWSLEAVVQCLNVSESAGPSPEMGISYANAGFWAGQLGLSRLAELYYERGRSMVEGSDLAGVEGYYYLSRATYALSVGLWDEAERSIERGLVANRRAGDKSRVEAGLTGGANADLQRGRYEDALVWLHRAEETLWPYGSPTQRMWCLSGLLFAHCRLRRPTGALVQRLDDVLEDVRGTVEFVLGHCWRARAVQLDGTRDEALTAIGLALEAVQSLSTTPFYAGNGMFAVLEAYFDLWAGASSDAERAALLPGMNVMRRKLTQVARVSRMTRAAAALADGRMHVLRGARRRARARLQKALEIAERHELRYEAACAHFELAHLHGIAAEDAARHDREATELFCQMRVPAPEPRPA
jgi:class 3 adenylate cyclase/tetratricopeptide (TPR) repeat protein